MLNKRDNENQYEYGLRIITEKANKNLDLDWDEIVDLLDLDCHRDSLRKAANTTPYSGVAVAKYYQDKIDNMIMENNPSLETLLEEIKNEKRELNKERIKLQDERRYKKNIERSEARAEMLIDELKNAIESLNETNPIQFEPEEWNIPQGNVASLLISDTHFGMQIDSFANKYNFEIAKERLVKLYQEVCVKCALHDVTTLNIELLGDLLHGYIHMSARILQESDVTKQISICVEYLSELIIGFANVIPNINIYCATGNHSRMVADLKKSLPVENFEKLILDMIKLRVAHCTNIVFHENEVDDDLVIYNVFDKTVVSTHGHTKNKKFDSVIHLSNYLGIKIDQVRLGHYHNFAIQKGVIINGSFCGSDQYAQSLGFSTPPSQTLIVYDGTKNQCIYDINLEV